MLAALRRNLRDQVANLGLSKPATRIYRAVANTDPRTAVANARYRRQGAPDGLPIPPSDLRFLVAGSTSISWFLEGGALAAASITDVLGNSGVPVEDLDAILDFGCGCGRVLRHWHALPHTRICGVDYNAALVEWCRANLPFAEVQANRLLPPLAYGDGEFDLVYALSVFTHLTEELQVSWIDELSRVVKPGGRLVISTHGEAYLHRLNEKELREFAAGRLVVKNNTKAPGSNTCSAYHPRAYVNDQMARGLEVVDFIAHGAKGNPQQDLYVLRKPGHVTPPTDAVRN